MSPDPLATTEVIGDPEAMRATARGWAARAAALGELAAVIGSTASDMGFKGPAAGRIVSQCEAARDATAGCAADLQALALRLLADAGHVEGTIAKAKSDAEAAVEHQRHEAEQQRLGAEKAAADQAAAQQAAAEQAAAAAQAASPDLPPAAPGAPPQEGG